MHSLTYAFFVPVFLISIGLKANARTLGTEGLAFAIAIIVVAILGKVLGCGLGARLGGFDWRESLRVGVGMVSRGEVGLIVAAVGLSSGLIHQNEYSTMVVMILATTLVTPLLLRWVFPKAEGENG
jgi:Kef-type K+ transport system membrane component KefB